MWRGESPSRRPRPPVLVGSDYKLTRRYADDADMNREMREVERWNDPAAAFLTVSPRGGASWQGGARGGPGAAKYA